MFNVDIREEKDTFILTRIKKRENEINEFTIYPSDLVFE